MLITSAIPYRSQALSLLATLGLPSQDLPLQLDHFYIMLAGEEVIGLAGLEIYEDTGLLRSVAIKLEYQGQGIGGMLLDKIAEIAIRKQLQGLILLTETAPGYFSRHGFTRIERDQVPDSVRESSEFHSVCPATAAVMYKPIIPKL